MDGQKQPWWMKVGQKDKLCTSAEVLKESERFLRYVGYQLQPVSYIGFVQPDFHARRQSEPTTYDVVGVVREGLDQAVDALVRLMALKAVLGESVDHVLVLPPVSEYLLIELLTKETGRLLHEIKRQQFMIWLCNPERETTTCLIGSTRDNRFNDYFAGSTSIAGGFEQFLMMRLSQQLEEE